MRSDQVYANLKKPARPDFGTGQAGFPCILLAEPAKWSRLVAKTGLAGFPCEVLNQLKFIPTRSEHLNDWRTPIINYLHNPSAKVDKSIRQLACKYVLVNNGLY